MINDANNDPIKKLVSQCLTKAVPRAHKPLRPLRRAIAIATIDNYGKFLINFCCCNKSVNFQFLAIKVEHFKHF